MKTFFSFVATTLVLICYRPAFAQGISQPSTALEIIGGIIIAGIFILIMTILACPDLATTLLNFLSKKRHP